MCIEAIDDHPPLGGRDEQPCVGGMRLLGQRVDDLARLLSRADPGLDRRQEWRRELLEVQARLIVLIPQEKTGDGHACRDSSDEHHREVREEEPRRDALGHAHAGATSLYPTPHTVSIFASAPVSLSLSCFTWTSTVRVSPG